MNITQRIDRVTEIPEGHLKTILPAPISVKIELSPRCNFRCEFCSLSDRVKQPTEDMDFDTFKRLAKELKDAGVEEIGIFYIGESLVNVDLTVNAIKYLKEIGISYVFLTSNASLAHPITVRRLMEAGLDSLKWSVNSYDENQFAQVTGVHPKVFRRIISNIKDAWILRNKEGFKTTLSASSIAYNDEQKKKMEPFLQEHIIPYVDKHYWLPLYHIDSFNKSIDKSLDYSQSNGAQGRLDTWKEPLPCWRLFTVGHIRADGKLPMCCFDGDGVFSAGNVMSQSFMDVWNSEKFQKIREAHLKGDVRGLPCESCVAYGNQPNKSKLS
jgi:MoaA/NifB/PqqE/SkfB family radical SAM enzyme